MSNQGNAMDYLELLCKAQKNFRNVEKTLIQSKELTQPRVIGTAEVPTENIHKFLAKQKAEVKKQKEEAQTKKDSITAIRLQKQIEQKLLSKKLRKNNTIKKQTSNVRVDDFLGCDEDDYGYVSTEASDFYKKMLFNYKFSESNPSGPKVVENKCHSHNNFNRKDYKTPKVEAGQSSKTISWTNVYNRERLRPEPFVTSGSRQNVEMKNKNDFHKQEILSNKTPPSKKMPHEVIKNIGKSTSENKTNVNFNTKTDLVQKKKMLLATNIKIEKLLLLRKKLSG